MTTTISAEHWEPSRSKSEPLRDTLPSTKTAPALSSGCILILILITTNQSVTPALSTQLSIAQTQYAALGLEATNWITSFQITPLNDSWGIPYWNQDTWGLDPYYFGNGTITGGTGNIGAGDRQELAYLIGGHDAGEGAYAALMAYLETRDPKYLEIFNVYYNYFESSQIPGPRTSTPAQNTIILGGKELTINNRGFWAEQASVSAGDAGVYGTQSDRTTLQAVYPAAEHGNPIAIALIAYYRLTQDETTLTMLNRYGNWLVQEQIRSGNYSGAFPVTQYYYYALGWKPRMYETTESAWVLAELYRLTGNQTYLKSSEEAGQYMLSRQLVGPLWRNTPVYGALPYEWNETHYTNSATTNHAGYTILAWCQLSQITGDVRYIQAAEKYANWLLSFQVTDPDTAWGNHTYANDPMAVGGFYYGYRVAQPEFGWRVAESLWSTSYAIPALLTLSQATGNDTYRRAAQLAANWLTEMKFNDQNQIPLQALAIMKFPVSSWWGRFPQYYQPDMEEIEKAGITTFVDHGRINVSSIKDQHPTWFERTFSVDFNLIDYAMANRGPTYMKMIWSWWPTVGFEPRYGGDIAFGAFGIDGYLRFNATLHNAEQTLSEIDELTGNNTKLLPKNSTAMHDQARTLIATANQNFNLGWYSLALAQADDAVALGRTVLTYTQVATPAAQNNDLLLGVLGVTLSALVISNAYWYKKLKHTAARGTRKQVRKRR